MLRWRRQKRFTTASLSCLTTPLGVLFVTILALALFTTLKDGLFPSLLMKGAAMVKTNLSPFVVGFLSSLAAGAAVLP